MLIFLRLLPCDSLYKSCKSSGVQTHTQSRSPLFKLNLTWMYIHKSNESRTLPCKEREARSVPHETASPCTHSRRSMGNPQAPVSSQESPRACPQGILLSSWFPLDFIFCVLSYNYKELQGITLSDAISPCKWESWSLDMLSNFPKSHLTSHGARISPGWPHTRPRLPSTGAALRHIFTVWPSLTLRCGAESQGRDCSRFCCLTHKTK